MNKRKVTIVLGALVLVLGFFGNRWLQSFKKPAERKAPADRAAEVYVVKAKPDTHTVNVDITGKLQAIQQIQLLSEVQGRFLESGKPFLEGVVYQKGETLVDIDHREFSLSVASQKATFKNTLIQALSDIKYDYPDEYEKVLSYTRSIETDKALPALPEFSESLSFFLSSRNIVSTFYSIRSAEAKLEKYTIKAPFKGVLSSVSTQPGGLVSPGQVLGQFLNYGSFELKAAVPQAVLKNLSVGDKVELHEPGDTSLSYIGKLTRIGKVIDPSQQTAFVFISIEDEDLKSGMYLTGFIRGASVNNAIEVSRSLLLSKNKLFIVKDSALKILPVQVLKLNDQTALVSGAAANTILLDQTLSNGFEGMKVKPIERSTK